MTYLHEAKGPLETLQAWVANVQVPKPVLGAVEQLTALLEAPAPRVASVTPLPFAAPAGCTCGTPSPVVHDLACPLSTFRSDLAEALGAVRREDGAPLALTTAEALDAVRDLREDLADARSQLEAATAAAREADARAVEQAAHWSGELARAVAAAQGPALVELLAAVDNAIARATMREGEPWAVVPIALWDALVEARDALAREDTPKPGADHG